MFLVACASSWVAVKMGQAKKQKEAVETLLKKGGTVIYDYELSPSGFIPGAIPPSPAWLRKLLGDDFFRTVPIVHLPGVKLTHADLESLKWIKQIQTLDLEKAPVTDSGLEQIKGLNTINKLYLSNTKITDKGMKHLEEMKQLIFLRLNDTPITDVGLEHLKGMDELLYLDLRNTQVTDAGVAKLRKALLPICKIER